MKTVTRIILPLLFFVAGDLWAAPCAKSDLLGTWEISKLDVIRRPRYANSPLYYKYQKRIFRSDGKMRHLVGAGPLTAEQEKEILKTPDNVEFDVGKDGVVAIRVAGRETDRFRCGVLEGGELEFTWPEIGSPTLVQRFRKKS